MKKFIPFILFTFWACPSLLQAQCSDCGNGSIDPGETYLNCPSDVLGTNMGASCAAPCGVPAGKDAAVGLRVTGIDFSTTSTNYFATAAATTATLPQTLAGGWTFGGATSATAASATPTMDVFGNQQGVVQPTSCCSNGQNGFVTASFTSSGSVGSGGCSGLLGANYDGQNNVSSNPSFVVLRGGSGFTKPTLVSPTYNNSGVGIFKIQFFIGANTTPGLSWGGCATRPSVFLDFSADGGSTWVQIMEMTATTSSDMCSAATSNRAWFTEGSWSRVCLTVFRTAASGNHPAGNYYSNAAGNTAPSGIMVDSRWFTNNFRYRLRYVSNGCDGSTAASNFNGPKPPGNPGRYVYIDYPVFTSGNQCIPCGLSFTNMCGYGDDTNDDGVGSDLTTTTASPITGIRRGVNMAEKGVEIFTLNGTSLTGSIFTTDNNPCDAEGRDKQCVTNGGIAVQFLVTQDYQPSGSCASTTIPTVFYYRLAGHGASSATAQSVQMSPVTTAGKANSIGWRSRATVFLNCTGSGDIFGGCQGYNFQLPTPTNQPRGFYNLYLDNTSGRSTSLYGAASSCRGYFGAPYIQPKIFPFFEATAPSGTSCAGGSLVFTADGSLCNSSAANTGLTVTVRGPLPSTTVHSTYTSGSDGSISILAPGDYRLEIQPTGASATNWGCIDCLGEQCITVTQAMIDNCVVTAPLQDIRLQSQSQGQGVALQWDSQGLEGKRAVLQRSSNGHQFEPIAQDLDLATGQFWDLLAPSGNLYYRLEWQGDDQLLYYSRVVHCEHQSLADQLFCWPNPANDFVHILLPSAGQLSIYNLQGQLYYQTQAQERKLDLNLDTWPKGSYVLHFIGSDGQKQQRLLIRQ